MWIVWSFILFWFGIILYDCRPRKPKPPVSVATLREVLDQAKAEHFAFRPISELIAEAERKAIAMHSPLAGDPLQAQVVANPVKVTEATSLMGGGVSHVPIEVTAIGDRERTFLAYGDREPPPVPNPEKYLLGRREALVREAEWITLSRTGHSPVLPARWEAILAELEVIEERLEAIARCRRNTTSGPGKPSRQSRPQTGHTPDPG